MCKLESSSGRSNACSSIIIPRELQSLKLVLARGILAMGLYSPVGAKLPCYEVVLFFIAAYMTQDFKRYLVKEP